MNTRQEYGKNVKSKREHNTGRKTLRKPKKESRIKITSYSPGCQCFRDSTA
jgi:hypothetical protein